ncbi:hypothetical protein MKZ38_001146 [Zalerion maritima]|uniref:Uncharacterized protein n=1 Tax=Zalerion maritima TaxID=339359 RepID=A0AAD5RS29_9PEZI|nr:hypothetical protein MKZ38_001146 [Zalerion maritima]
MHRNRGFIAGNDFAIPYVSNHSRIHDSNRGLLNFANCSYLSTSGRSPTLEDLKRHAQSLCILISQLSLTTKPTSITRAKGVIGDFDQNDAYDWLHDLSQPYSNPDKTHQAPLNSLLNEAKTHHETMGTEYHCPLVEMKPHVRKVGHARMPYASHHNLVMHANACLEFLDHEYGATGGMLSIIPTDQDHDTEDLAAAKNTLLGQWLRYTQHLVGRMHELEIAYGNALEALGGEATVPARMNAHQGPDGVTGGRAIVHGQDKWILANAGPDVLSYIHRQLDRAEAQIEQKEAIWRNSGVMGSRMWMEERGGETYAKGIVPVNISTRYYRLRGEAGKGTPIFVLPAWEHHPAVEHTRELEKRPTVVSVVTPQWPERVSELMKRNQERLKKATDTEMEMEDVSRLLTAAQSDITLLQQELERERARSEYAEAQLGEITSKEGGGETIGVGGAASGRNMPRNPLPLKLDNANMRSQIEGLQKRETDYRQEIKGLQGRISELEATVKIGALSLADEERRQYEENVTMFQNARKGRERSMSRKRPEGTAEVAARERREEQAKKEKEMSERSKEKLRAREDIDMFGA